MNRLIIFVGMLCIAASLHAQQSIKLDAGLGAALAFGDFSAGGISASAEPKFFIKPQISVGLRFEGDVLFAGSVDSDTEFDVGLSSRAAQVIKGEYYFSENSTRPFVGAMFGRYTQANLGGSSSGDASISASSGFGFAPEVGITFNNFRISGIYHIVSGKGEIANVGAGQPQEISRNYLVLQIGFKIFNFDI